MKNPLKDLSRPKALGLAGAAAGVLAMSGAAAAMNVGLLSSGAAKPFSPQPISLIEDQPTTTTASDPVIVYEDVYETVPAPSVPGVAPAAPSSGSVSDDDDQGTQDDPDDADYDDDDQGTQDDSDYDDDDDHDSDHESEDADHEQSEDHGEDD